MDIEQMRQDTAMAISGWPTEHVAGYYEECSRLNTPPSFWESELKRADRAIAAAEPHIRRKVLEELIADTVWIDAWAEPGTLRHERMSESRQTITDWLRSKLEG